MMKYLFSFLLALLVQCVQAAVPVTSGYVDISQNGKIYYEVYGEGEPLFLLHGHSLDRRMWQPQIDAFSALYKVYIIDFRGYGLSSKMSEDLHTTHVDDLVEVMDKLGVKKAHIIGLSMGGFIAGDMVGMYPNRMLSCVMSSGAMRTSHPSIHDAVTASEIAKQDSIVARNKAYGIELMRKEWIEQLITHGGSRQENIRESLTQQINDWDAWQLQHREPHLYYGREAYDSLKSRRPAVPTLYLSGEMEHKKRMGLLNYLPVSEQIELKDCGHMSNMEQPEAWNDSVLSFLRRHGGIVHRYPHFPPVYSKTSASARALLEQLYTNVDKGKIMSGLHHNQLNMPNYRRDLDRIEQAVPGAVPMVWGGDLAWDADKVVQMAIDHHKKGYVIALSWHAARPFDKGPVNFKKQTQGKLTDEQWAELLTEGSEMHTQWLAQVDSIAEYLKVLRAKDVPVLWRPYHEMNGEWFWWGNRRGQEGFTVLWKMLYERLASHHKLRNLIWVWNPNNPRKHPMDREMGYDLYYPGDKYVDVLATDVYHREWFQDTHDQLLTLGGGKLIAIGEVGELPTAEQLASYNRYAWFMLWTNFCEDKYNTLDALKEIFADPRVINK